MSDENATPQGGATPASPAAVIQTATDRLREGVRKALAGSGPLVYGLIEDKMRTEEIENRKNATLAVIAKIETKTKELRKIEQAGDYTFDAFGVKLGGPKYSKQQAGDMKQTREQIDKLQKALSKAFEDSDFKAVMELGGKSSAEGAKSDAGPTQS